MTLNPNGQGLGLYTSRTIMRHLGGDITCVSTYDHGSTFTVTCPMVKHLNKKLVQSV
jgi:signal transduction histidine kinase